MLLLTFERHSKRTVWFCTPWGERYRFARSFNRILILMKVPVTQAEIALGLYQVRPQLKSDLISLNGLAKPAGLNQYPTETGASDSIIRIQLDGSLPGGNRLIVFPESRQQGGQIY